MILRKVRMTCCRLITLAIDEVADMVDEGIVDSLNVIKSILMDAVSLVGMLITTECLVVKEKNYERKHLPSPPNPLNSDAFEALPG